MLSGAHGESPAELSPTRYAGLGQAAQAKLAPLAPLIRRCSGGVRLHRGDEHRRWRCWRRWGAISRRGVRLAAPPAAVRGCSHAPSPRAEVGVRWEPVDGIGERIIAAGAWRGWPMATVPLLEAEGRDFEA
eukprot:scaffold7918_cov136-Isochrysis_galbana.AAC.3